jgi:ferritin-like metal-binding protein YciE
MRNLEPLTVKEVFMEKQATLSRIFTLELRAIYLAEKQIYEGLEKMAAEAASPELRHIFQHHRQETANQILRLEKVGKLLQLDVTTSHPNEKAGFFEKGKDVLKHLLSYAMPADNKAVTGLMNQEKMLLGELSDQRLEKDMALTTGGQVIEEFEIVSYRTLIAIARQARLPNVTKLLEENLEEEQKAFEKLSLQFQEELQEVSA